MSETENGEIPTEGKANRHTIPNERQCWVLQWHTGGENWRVEGVYLTFDAVEEAEQNLREKFAQMGEDVWTKHGSWASPSELHGGEHLVNTDQ